jgi:membrane-bound lytic murein transglycosylase F
MRFFNLVILFPFLLAGCGKGAGVVEPYTRTGELVVITRNSPTTYYEDASGQPAGIEHDLVELFARELGVKVRFIQASRFNQILPAVMAHQAHFAAAGLTVTPEREKLVTFGPAYQTIHQQIAYNTDSLRPANIQGLVGGRIEVVAGSSYVEQLEAMRATFPQLKWREQETLESEELLERVASGQTDYVVADSNIIEISKTYMPNLDAAFDISPPQSLAWAFPKDVSPELLAKADAFFARIHKDGTLKALLERYYGHTQRLESADIAEMLDKRTETLPRFRKYFQEGQDASDIDWRLLAALAYQESHWDPLATSPTGVRGIMMLTEDTADRLGVGNRLDARESIRAGAKYIASLKDMLPPRIPEPDRTWLALAAYNMGYGHLEDARVLAQRMRMNPDSWASIKQVLPLLGQSAYYPKLKHGYARGGQAVIFVESIRNYYDLLARFEPAYQANFNLVEAGR